MTNNKNKILQWKLAIKKSMRSYQSRRETFLKNMRTLNSHHKRALVAGVTPQMQPYDLELLFVQCGICGRPVIWEEGRITTLLLSMGIDPLELDAYCMIMTHGCTFCRPGQEHFFTILRFSKDDAHFIPHEGHA